MKSEIFEILAGIKGHRMVHITTLTDVRMNKTGNPFYGRVQKMTSVGVSFNRSYENSVNNKIEKNGGERTFKSEPLPYGEWIKGLENKMYEHKGVVYVRFYTKPNEVAKVTYYLDGVAIEKGSMMEKEIMAWIPTKSHTSKKQEDAGLSKEEQVYPYGVKLENILRVAFKGVAEK